MRRSVLLALLAAAGLQGEEPRLRGFSAESSRRQREVERRLGEILSPERAEEHLRWLTARPHRVGTEGARVTAEYLDRELRAYGFETETVRYEALLPSPVSVSLEMLEPVRETLPTTEEPIEGDPFTETAGEHAGWNGYSPSGEAVGEVVYARHGSEEDLRTLRSMGVDLRGKILLLRYFGAGEGRKVANAEKAGAAGVVLYSDPDEDGYRYGDVYPDGNWRPPGSIMRRSVEFFPHSGDPLSPGFPSLPGAKRLSIEEVNLPGIPVLPISYRSAEKLLRHLGGPVVPSGWQGALPLTYKTGPGPVKLRMRTEMEIRDKPMWNVVGRLPGSELPDQWVVASNHHDAWIYGAGDPSSGTASLLELARGVGELARSGLPPRRTLVVAFWDGEEMLLGGSTEWVEHQYDELLEKAVACINMDSSVFHTERPLKVAAHPALHRLFREVASDLRDPRTGRDLASVWLELQKRYRFVPSVDGWSGLLRREGELTEPWIFEIPYDDATPFFHQLALPASDMYYGNDYGMYHSLYENFHWMKTVVDPTFEYHVLMAKLQGFVALRLANADLVPLDYANEARLWRKAYRDLEEVARGRGQEVPRLDEALALIDRWEERAAALETRMEAFLEAPRDLGAVNESYYRIARDFHRPRGRAGAPLERNLFAGSSHDFEAVSGSTLPGMRFALDRGDLERAASESAVYLEALRRRLTRLEEFEGMVQ